MFFIFSFLLSFVHVFHFFFISFIFFSFFCFSVFFSIFHSSLLFLFIFWVARNPIFFDLNCFKISCNISFFYKKICLSRLGGCTSLGSPFSFFSCLFSKKQKFFLKNFFLFSFSFFLFFPRKKVFFFSFFLYFFQICFIAGISIIV